MELLGSPVPDENNQEVAKKQRVTSVRKAAVERASATWTLLATRFREANESGYVTAELRVLRSESFDARRDALHAKCIDVKLYIQAIALNFNCKQDV